MQKLPKNKSIRSWTPKRKREAFIVLELAKRRRGRAASTVEEIPNAPESLGILVTDSDFVLSWTDLSNNEDGFRVYRSAFSSPFELIAECDPNQIEYVDAAVDFGVFYTYYVVAFNSVGESAPSNSVLGELASA